jgi:hypothetical protein
MWPGTDLLARVLVEEREHKIARAEVMRTLRGEEERFYAEDEPVWAASLVVLAILVIALVGGSFLV